MASRSESYLPKIAGQVRYFSDPELGEYSDELCLLLNECKRKGDQRALSKMEGLDDQLHEIANGASLKMEPWQIFWCRSSEPYAMVPVYRLEDRPYFVVFCILKIENCFTTMALYCGSDKSLIKLSYSGLDPWNDLVLPRIRALLEET